MRISALLVVAPFVLACSGAEPPTAPNALPVEPGVAAPMGVATNGIWKKTGYAVTGTVQVVAANGVAQLRMSSDFSVAQTPGPVVYLNTTNNPNTGQPLRVGVLKSRNGAQDYTFQVPAGVRYSWVLIWCDPFNAAMAEAAIAQTP